MMMTDNEPMSEERIQTIQHQFDSVRSDLLRIENAPLRRKIAHFFEFAPELLAEVERLRASRAKVTEAYNHLEDENVALREIVEDVAAVVWSSYCPWCNRHGVMHEVEHYEGCPVLAARALTGVTPDTDDEE